MTKFNGNNKFQLRKLKNSKTQRGFNPKDQYQREDANTGRRTYWGREREAVEVEEMLREAIDFCGKAFYFRKSSCFLKSETKKVAVLLFI